MFWLPCLFGLEKQIKSFPLTEIIEQRSQKCCLYKFATITKAWIKQR